MKSIAVIGSGQMGMGIAQVSASSGLKVQVIDTNDKALENAHDSILKSLDKLAAKGKIATDQVIKTMSRLHFTQDLPHTDCDLVIEAIVENLDLKNKLFKEIEDVISPNTILASNTSSIAISTLAHAIKKPERFIGIHFMNPVPIIPLIEVIPGEKTNEATITKALVYCDLLQKNAVMVKDRPGFVVNRLLIPMINEAFFALSEQLASAADIDKAMTLGANQPIGPLHLADLIGLDTCLAIMKLFHKDLGDDKYRPCPLLAQYVKDGMLGRKTGQGVFQYESKSQ